MLIQPAIATLALLSGSGTWTVAQDYGGGAGVVFVEHFEFHQRAHRALREGTTKVPLRVTVRASASGAYRDARLPAPGLQAYTCTGDAAPYRDTATVRVTHGRLTVVALRDVQPGAATCTQEDAAFFPTGAPWFTRRMTVHRRLSFGLGALTAPQRSHDCSDPVSVGTCVEELAWTGRIRLSH